MQQQDVDEVRRLHRLFPAYERCELRAAKLPPANRDELRDARAHRHELRRENPEPEDSPSL